MKSITVPYVEGLDSLDRDALFAAMEASASSDSISVIDWEEHPYKPAVRFWIARSAERLYVMYSVEEETSRAVEGEDHGKVWEDSCVEFFCSPECNDRYVNFETNCIGMMHVGYHVPGETTVKLDQEGLASIRRFTTLPYGETFEDRPAEGAWKLAIAIPFSLLGLDGASLPDSITGNFYKCGDKQAKPHYISWNRIETPKPSFHQPGYFGKIIFE